MTQYQFCRIFVIFPVGISSFYLCVNINNSCSAIGTDFVGDYYQLHNTESLQEAQLVSDGKVDEFVKIVPRNLEKCTERQGSDI